MIFERPAGLAHGLFQVEANDEDEPERESTRLDARSGLAQGRELCVTGTTCNLTDA